MDYIIKKYIINKKLLFFTIIILNNKIPCIIISQMIYLYIRLKSIIFMFGGIIWNTEEEQG